MNNDNIPEKPFHSNTYAEVANGGSIGSTNAETFSQRYSVDQNRRAIRKYRDSYVGRGALTHQARRGAVDPFARVDPSIKAMPPIGHRPTPPPTPRASFKEPPARGFNPYS